MKRRSHVNKLNCAGALSNQALQAPPRHSLRMPGYPRSKNSLGAPERDVRPPGVSLCQAQESIGSLQKPMAGVGVYPSSGKDGWC